MDLFEMALKLTTQGESEVKTALHSVKSSAEELKQTFTELAAVLGLGLGLEKVIEATSEAQYATAQLNAALKSTGGTAGETLSDVERLGKEMQRLTIYSDDTTASAASILLAFQHIRDDAFDRTIQSAANLGARLGMDLPSATRLLGRALEDPATGFMMLRRAGIIFTEAQKDVIKSLAESGNLAKAQSILLDELERRFGGAAEAAGNTFGGALAKLKNALEDLVEFDGEATKGVVALMNAMTEGAKVVLKYREEIGLLLAAIAGAGLAQALKTAAPLIIGFGTTVVSVMRAIMAEAVLMGGGWKTVLMLMRTDLALFTESLMASPLAPLVLAAIGAAAIKATYDAWSDFYEGKEQLEDDDKQREIANTVRLQAGRAKVARDKAQADEIAKAQSDAAEAAEEKRIGLIQKLFPLTAHTASEYAKLGEEIEAYTKKSEAANISDERRLVLLERRNNLSEALKKGGGELTKTSTGYAAAEMPDEISDTAKKAMENIGRDTSWITAMTSKMMEALRPTDAQLKTEAEYMIEGYAKELSLSIAAIRLPVAVVLAATMHGLVQDAMDKMSNSLGPALSKGFGALFSGQGIGGAMKAFGKSLLSSFGSILVSLGEQVIAAAGLLKIVLTAFKTMNPYAMLAAGIGLIAIGSMLSAAGSNAVSSGTGNGTTQATSGFIGSPINFGPGYPTQSNTMASAGMLSPASPMNVTIIGPNDPVAQTQLLQMIDKAQRRGG